ncbi:MAG: transglutaminase-like domain-containing protein [Myxococcota bacterium]
MLPDEPPSARPYDPRGEARRQFAAAVALPEPEIDVARAALWLAAEADPRAEVDRHLERLDALGEAARAGVEAAADAAEAVAHLNHVLFERERFRGNEHDYYDPRNSFLGDVLDRRRGIPITLSIVYVEVARRAGLEAHGVGFPGHFLAKVVDRDGGAIVVDAFHGRVLTRDACAERLRGALGPQAVLADEHLAAASAHQTLRRMLTNLKQIHLQRRQLDAALACVDRILLLAPDDALELRDRGLLYQALECFAPAIDDLERFLALAPGDASAPRVERVLAQLRERAPKLH